MHWLDSQLQVLYKLAETYQNSRSTGSEKDSHEQIRQSRAEFIDQVQQLTESIVKLADISACVAVHDGLILAQAGNLIDSDALGMMIQETVAIGERSKGLLSLGEIQQIVMVGEKNKIAMLSVGQLTLGIVSPKQVNLAESLSKKPD